MNGDDMDYLIDILEFFNSNIRELEGDIIKLKKKIVVLDKH